MKVRLKDTNNFAVKPISKDLLHLQCTNVWLFLVFFAFACQTNQQHKIIVEEGFVISCMQL